MRNEENILQLAIIGLSLVLIPYSFFLRRKLCIKIYFNIQGNPYAIVKHSNFSNFQWSTITKQ